MQKLYETFKHLQIQNYSRKYGTKMIFLYLICEKSIWKNQVRRTIFELDFYCLSSLQKSILKSSLSNLIFTTVFFKNKVQIKKE